MAWPRRNYDYLCDCEAIMNNWPLTYFPDGYICLVKVRTERERIFLSVTR